MSVVYLVVATRKRETTEDDDEGEDDYNRNAGFWRDLSDNWDTMRGEEGHMRPKNALKFNLQGGGGAV